MTGGSDMPAEARRLAAGWLLLAVVALGMSTACALLLVAARAPLPESLGFGALFRSALVLHVGLAVLVWFLSCAAGFWTLAAASAPSPLHRSALLLSCAGVAAMAAGLFSAPSAAVLSNYVPVLDSRVFLLGLSCFLSGIAGSAASSMRGLYAQVRQRRREIWRIAAALAAGIVLLALGTLVLSLASAGVPARPQDYEVLAWGPGHMLQFTHVLLLMAAWILLAEQALGKPVAARAVLIALLLLAAVPVLAAPLLYAMHPIESAAFRQAFTRLMAWSAWPSAALLGMLVLLRLASAGRETLKQAAPIVLSILLFLLGCCFGAAIRGESTMVPAHYHGTIGAVTLAYMALGYRLLREYGLGTTLGCLARHQPLLYGTGLLLLASGLAWSGWMGVPRKTPHMEILAQHPAYFAAMGLAGLGGFLAVSGAALFVFNVARALRHRYFLEFPRQGMPRMRPAMLPAALVALTSSLLLACVPSQDAAKEVDKSDPAHRAALARKDDIARHFADGVALLNARHYDAAVTALHRVLKLAPRMPEAHVNMGFAMLGLNRHAAARDFFEAAIELRPTQTNAYFGLAVALEGLRDLPGALGAMRSYAHLAKPDDAYLRRANAAIWEWEEKLKAAVPESGKAAVRYPILEKKLN